MSNKIHKLGELFCGPGGIGQGAKEASVDTQQGIYRIRHAWATDIDEDACETYRHNLMKDHPEAVICGDIRELDFEHLKEISDIDGLTFGFPCNDFSLVGEQKGINGEYGPLYTYGVKALEYFQPKWFFAENVSGLRSSNEGEAFQIILESLEQAGYVITPHLYKFENYGVPQARHRIIVVGIRKDLEEKGINFQVPSSISYQSEDVSAKGALEDPPIPDDAPNQELTNHSETVVKRLAHIKPGENAFTADLPEALQLNVKGAKISQIYKRLEADKPSYTVTGSGGGGTHVYHWKENRALTNRERARLQTFPDHFEFCGPKESVRKQIGMAVPVKGAKVIFEAILKTFAGIDYPAADPNIPYTKSFFSELDQPGR